MASTSAPQRALIYRRGSVYLTTNSGDFSDNICEMLQGDPNALISRKRATLRPNSCALRSQNRRRFRQRGVPYMRR